MNVVVGCVLVGSVVETQTLVLRQEDVVTGWVERKAVGVLTGQVEMEVPPGG